MKKLIAFTLTLISFLTSAICAHELKGKVDLRFDRISIEQGLSQVTVYTIMQDNRGFIWVGTMDGLNKFDGYKFTVFRNNPFDSTSISNNRVRVIFEDKNNMLWIGTDGGLNKYDPEINSFIPFLHNPSDPASISNNFIQAICQDTSKFLWVATSNGLNRLDPLTGLNRRFKTDQSDKESLLDNNITALLCDQNNNLWIGTKKGLQKRSAKTGKFKDIHHPALDNTSVLSIYRDPDQSLWIGTDRGLVQIKNSDSENLIINDKSGLFKNDMPLSFYSSIKDRQSNMWFGTSNGLFKADENQNIVKHYTYQADDVFSLGGNEVRSIFEDRSHTIWIGLYGGGISKFELREGYFEGYTFATLDEKFVYAITEDLAGNVWIGSNAGIQQIGKNFKLLKRYTKASSRAGLSDNRIRSLYADKKGYIWVGTYGGLNIINPTTGLVTKYYHQPDNPASLSDNTIIHIFEDSQENIWIGTQGGLNLFDRETKRFFHYRHDPNDPASLSENQVRRIFEDNQGNIWIGTYGGGLNLFNPANNSFTIFKNNPTNPNSLSSNYVYSIFQDSQNNLWIGTYGGGLNRFDYQSSIFDCYKVTDGLPNEVIYGILEDNERNLWLTTNLGISRFNIDSAVVANRLRPVTFRNYDMGDGLLSNEFNFGSYYKCIHGTIYLGCINGLIYFQPGEMRDNKIPPRVVLTDFYLANQPVSHFMVDGQKKHINNLKAMNLSYKDNIITFEFAALHYSNPANNRYAHMLEGVDPDWVYTNADRRFATYTTLPGGNYTFRVKAANSDGKWQTVSTDLELYIIPPFWETWYFRSAIILIIVILIVMFTRLRTRQINLRNKYLESINAELNKNILHRKQAETDLQESEEKFRTLTTNLNAGIYRIIPEGKGKFVEINPELIKILGYKNKSQLLKVPVHDIYNNPEDRKKFIQDIGRKGHIENRELLLKKKDGTPVWCSINAVVVKNESGSVLYHDGIIDDISEKKLMENRIRQTQKMEAIGQLAGGVAHDFNNILTVIQGHAELGMMKIDKSSPAYKDFSEIHVSGERAGNLTRQLLAFSRKQPMTLQILDINKVITNLEKMVRRLIGEDISININLAADLPAINADPGQLEQILLNILINARDAIDSNQKANDRTITIDTQFINLGKEFVKHHPGSKSGPHVLLAVGDTGIGMDDQVKTKIFDPFFTTKEPGKGTGLGLATVFGIVKQNNGSIYVVSEPDKGTTFTIYWPAVKQTIETARKKAITRKKLEGKEAILLVEDDEAVRLFTFEILTNLGYKVAQATDGEAALYQLNEKKFNPDLLITDIVMPKMSGQELAAQVKKLLPAIKVLLMSGYSANHINMSHKLGKDFHFISKPFSINDFAKKIREVIRK